MKGQKEEKAVLRIRCKKMPEQFLNTKANNAMNMCASLELNFYFVCTDKIYREVYTLCFHKGVLARGQVAFTETLSCNSSVTLFVREQCLSEGIRKRKKKLHITCSQYTLYYMKKK